MDEMSVEVKVTYSCHRCHKEMEKKDISPFMEWHICDKCMGYEETKPLYTQKAMVIYSKEVTKNEK